jgi:hypothetical protein
MGILCPGDREQPGDAPQLPLKGVQVTSMKTLILAAFAILLTAGCAATTIGKIDLSTGQTPSFLTIGRTTQQDVLARLGEPLGYREQGARSVMSYEHVEMRFLWFGIGSYQQERAYRLYAVFDDNVLSKAEVRRDGWGFAGNIDPQLLQLLIR